MPSKSRRIPGLSYRQTYMFRRALKLERRVREELSYFALPDAQRAVDEIDRLLHASFGREWREFKDAREVREAQTVGKTLLLT